MSQGGWGEAKRNHEGDDGKGKFPLPIVPRALNAIFYWDTQGKSVRRREPAFCVGLSRFRTNLSNTIAKTKSGADLGGGCRGCAPPPPEMTCGFLIQLVFCQTMWFIGVEVEQEKNAPPPKKNPGSAPESRGHIVFYFLKRINHNLVLA